MFFALQEFFLREGVSRCLPHQRYATKKYGTAYDMVVTLRAAHKQFLAEFSDKNLSFSAFTQLRPKNVKNLVQCSWRHTSALIATTYSKVFSNEALLISLILLPILLTFISCSFKSLFLYVDYLFDLDFLLSAYMVLFEPKNLTYIQLTALV